MDIGSWIKQNKLAAGGVAAGAGFLYLSRKGSSSSPGAVGQLVPVAAGYPNENMTPIDTTGDTTDTTGTIIDPAIPPDPLPPIDIPADVTPVDVAPAVPPSAPFVATPSPSSLTPPPVVAYVPPPPPPTVQKYDLPGGYTPGIVLGYGAGTPGNIDMVIGNKLGWRQVGAGANSNGSYNTIRFFSDVGATGDWNIYYSGAKKGQWVGPFNLGRTP